MTLLPIEDLIVVVREFINPEVSRAGLEQSHAHVDRQAAHQPPHQQEA